MSALTGARLAAEAGADAGQPEAPNAALGLYVHVPFCEVKCTYCHFAIDPRRPDDARQERYVRAVLAEMAAAEAGRATACCG